jgi:hypothetical protein
VALAICLHTRPLFLCRDKIRVLGQSPFYAMVSLSVCHALVALLVQLVTVSIALLLKVDRHYGWRQLCTLCITE